MSAIVSVYAVFASDEEARRIGRAMVEEKLAACVNLIGACHSIYRWNGDIEEAAEVAGIFKTEAAQAPRLTARIGELHSYDVPAIVTWPITNAASAYRDWIVANVEDGYVG